MGIPIMSRIPINTQVNYSYREVLLSVFAFGQLSGFSFHT